jgi:hypothetical protein
MIFFPARRKASARKFFFLSYPLKRLLHGNITLFPACGKTFDRIFFYLLPVERLLPGDIISMFCPLKGFCPGEVIFFPAAGMAAARLSLSADQIPSAQVGRARWCLWVSVSLTSLRASEVSGVWSRYRSSSRGGALFNVSIFKVPTDSVFIESLLSRIFSHRYMHTGGALSHFLSCANLLVHDWLLITLSVAEGRQESFHC